MLADVVDRLCPEGSLAVPDHRRDRGKAEWDWYYQLGSADRKRVLRACKPGGIEPDICAAAAGFEYVDEWAAEFLAAVVARKTEWDTMSEYPDTMTLAPDALVGPVEVAELCGVKVDTVYQWVGRGRLPEPWAVVSGTRLWPRHVVETWALETGRIVPGVEVDDVF